MRVVRFSKLLLFAGVLVGRPIVGQAQQPPAVAGRVVNESSAPVKGALVSIATLGAATYTNDEGRYTLSVPAGKWSDQAVALTVRRIGLAPLTRSIVLRAGGTLTQDFVLSATTTRLDAVIVTALGQEKERSQLGTAVTQLSNQQLNVTRTQNLMQQVQGKVAGVNVTGAGTQGGSANIIIRGANSLTGSNQPLYVVDGIPVSNASRGGSLGGGSITTGGRDFGNAISDLNPDDVETMTILKGPNAAALYGSRASNGVVVITTKRGASSNGLIRTELATTISMETPSRMWDLQNQYGQGSGGSFDYVDGAGSGDCDGCDQSYGPKLDGRLIHQFTDGSDTTVKSPWIAHPNNVRDFFNTGRTVSTTLAASGGTERANARLSLGADAVSGIVPNNTFQKVTSLLSGQMLVNSKLTTNASIQYVRNNGLNRPTSGYSGALEQFFWFGRQIDLDALRNYGQGGLTNNGPSDREYNWNYNFHNNPFWLQYENQARDARDRFIGNVSATYSLADGVAATLRTGSDIFRYNINQQFAPGNLSVPENLSYQGAFSTITDYSNENNTDLLVTAKRSLTDRLRVNASVGGNLRRSQFSTESQSTNALLVNGLYNISNSAVAPTVSQRFEKRATNSAYGSLALTLNDWWTVEGTARNDWSSTLPSVNNSYFYPSVNSSLVLSDAIPALKVGPVSYLKVRGSVARVGSDASPYQLATVFQGVSAKLNGQAQYQLSDSLANADLKPEITQSSEAGAELGLWDGRVSFDGTVYANKTRNQILNATVSSASGFAVKAINAGLLENHGVELQLNVTPIRSANGFEWTTSFNYAHNKNTVTELSPGITSLQLGPGLFADARVVAAVGQPYGQIKARGFVRDSVTGAIMTANGRPLGTTDLLPMGNIQPTWTGGWNNTLTFKGVSLGVLLDFHRGGKIVSYTNSVGESSGQLASTLAGREVDWDNPGVVVKGIDRATCGAGSHALTDGSGQYVCVGGGTPNTRNITSEVYFQSLFQNMEPYIYDGSYTKLRELRVGFDLPSTWAARLNSQSASIGLVGRNLLMWTNVPNIDPEFAYSNTNNQGLEYAFPPNPRSIGFSLRITP